MKSFFSLFFFLPLFLYGFDYFSLRYTTTAEIDDTVLLLSQAQDLRFKGGSGYPWSGSLFLELTPPELDSSSTIPTYEYGLTLILPHLTAGRLTLSGIYDRLESSSFPSLYSWDRGPGILAEKGSVFNDHYGWAVHNKEKSIIFHYLDNPGGRQFGTALDLKRDNFPLTMEAVGLVSFIEGEEDDDESWYDQDKPVSKDELIHLQARLNYEIFQSLNLWLLSCEGAILLPRFSRRGGQFMLSLFYEKNNFSFLLLGGFHEGSWLSCRGEDTRWERGGGINITLFNDKNIIIKGSALAYTLPTNIWESQDKISYEWDTGVKSPWFEMKVGEAFNGKTNQHRRRIQGKGGFYAPWGSLEGEGIWVHETLWNRSVKLKGNFAGGKNVKSFIFKTSLELFHNNISLPHDYDLISSCETCLFFFNNWEGRFSLLLPLKKNNPWQEGAEFTGEISFKY